MMMTSTESVQPRPNTHALRSVVVVANEPADRVLETVASAYDVVFVAPTATAYSQIKRVSPTVVVLCLTFDDSASYQLMTMLKLDRETSDIPVVPCLF